MENVRGSLLIIKGNTEIETKEKGPVLEKLQQIQVRMSAKKRTLEKCNIESKKVGSHIHEEKSVL